MTRNPNATDVLVGTRVRIRRVELGLSQTELASALGVTFQQVQKYEKGTNRIGASRLHAMAGVLRVPVSYFFPVAGVGESPSARPNDALVLLGIPGALDLLKNFARIRNQTVQKALCVMAESLAKDANSAQQTAH